MKLEDQILSIEQVRELQELGFDVEKYASMCWISYTSDEEPYEKEHSLSILDEFCYESASLEPTPTMSIGDIIEVLPPHIYPSIYHKKYGKEIEQTHLLIMYPYSNFGCLIRYKHHNQDTFVFESIEKPYIKALFETLKWCIKEKHIKL
jgi:hypothetical protein